jgi:hypothetical protein
LLNNEAGVDYLAVENKAHGYKNVYKSLGG